jgi:F-type H+-transporting ATPase subunit b
VLIDWFTVLAQIVNFLILIFLLKRFLYGPIIRAVEEREKKIAAAMDRARRAEKEAKKRSQELLREKEALLEAKAGFLADAKKEVEAWRERTVTEARREVEKMRQFWLDRLDQDKLSFFVKLKEQVARQIVRIGEKVLHDLANEGLERQVVEVFLRKMEQEISRFQVKRISGTVKVQSGFELGDELTEELRSRVSVWFPQAQPIRFEVASELGIGLQVLAGDRKVDWNLTSYLEELEKEILATLHDTGQEAA